VAAAHDQTAPVAVSAPLASSVNSSKTTNEQAPSSPDTKNENSTTSAVDTSKQTVASTQPSIATVSDRLIPVTESGSSGSDNAVSPSLAAAGNNSADGKKANGHDDGHSNHFHAIVGGMPTATVSITIGQSPPSNVTNTGSNGGGNNSSANAIIIENNNVNNVNNNSTSNNSKSDKSDASRKDDNSKSSKDSTNQSEALRSATESKNAASLVAQEIRKTVLRSSAAVPSSKDDLSVTRYRDPRTIHTLITSNGSPYQNFQARIMYGTYKIVQKMPGGEFMTGFTRILHRSINDEIVKEIPTFRAKPLHPACDTWCDFPVADRPDAVVQWITAARQDPSMIKGHFLLLLETDYVWDKPLVIPDWLVLNAMEDYVKAGVVGSMIDSTDGSKDKKGKEGEGVIVAAKKDEEESSMMMAKAEMSKLYKEMHERPLQGESEVNRRKNLRGIAFLFNYIMPNHPNCEGVIRNLSGQDPNKVPRSGPAPVLLLFSDFEKVVPHWANVTAAIEADSKAVRVLGWVREMYAWDIALVRAGLGESLLTTASPESLLISQPPHDQRIGNAAMFHYTWGVIYCHQKEYNAAMREGKDPATASGIWRWDKRDFTPAEVALKVPTIPLPPPWEQDLLTHEGHPVSKEMHETLVQMLTRMNQAIETLDDLSSPPNVSV